MPDAKSEIEIAACDSCGRMKCVPLSLEAPAVCHYCADGDLDALLLWRTLGQRGFVVSICFGPCGDNNPLFSVNAMTADGRSFDRPYGALTFKQALDIASTEIEKRGWE